MKPHVGLSTAFAAGVLFLGAFTPASAITISNVAQDLVGFPTTSSAPQLPNFAPALAGTIDTPTGDSGGIFRSPWEDLVTNAPIVPYQSTLQYTSVRDGGAGYNATGNSLSLFWGSPDIYNSIVFYTGLNGTGESVTESGTALLFPAYGTGHDQVTITTDIHFLSFALFSTTPAFEFTNLAAACSDCAPAPTPLPGALPLFASAFAGVGGLLGWRKKRKAKAVAA